MTNPAPVQSRQQTTANPASTSFKRLLSLDVVRGITIAFMIMVNNNGGPGSWRFMNHADWNGLTPTDLVFPTFAFVIGVSIVFAFSARLERGASKGELARHTVQRALILILFGIIVNSFPFFGLDRVPLAKVLYVLGVPAICAAAMAVAASFSMIATLAIGFVLLWFFGFPAVLVSLVACLSWKPADNHRLSASQLLPRFLLAFGFLSASLDYQVTHERIYGVLQRLAVCYLVAGLFYLYDQRAWTKWAALATALVGYWLLIRWVPIPGAGVPGHDVPFMDMTQNLTSWIDRHVFPYHLYLYSPDHNVRDPEGLLSDLPAIGTTLMGVLAGIWLRTSRTVRAKSAGLALASIVSLTVGYLWSLEFPLNKNMWTSSFVLVAGGCSLALLTVLYWAVEERNWRKGWTWPWLVFGSNAIAAYMFSELLPSALYLIRFSSGNRIVSLGEFIFVHVFAHIPDRGWAAFAWSVSFTALCFIPVWILYRKKIFLKV